MPAGIDEKCWKRATEIATQYFGGRPNNDVEWAYTMGIYKHMCMQLPRGSSKFTRVGTRQKRRRRIRRGETPEQLQLSIFESQKPKTEYERIAALLRSEGISEEMAEYIIELRLQGQNQRANDLYVQHRKG